MTPEELESARAELRSIAAGLRGLLEWHGYAGTDALPASSSIAAGTDAADAAAPAAALDVKPPTPALPPQRTPHP